MIFMSILRAIGAFFASLPGALEEAQRMRREFQRRYPYADL
jgi:hypothetical protein